MEIIHQLSNRVQQAAEEIMFLRKEKERLISEVETLRHQLEDQDKIFHENQQLKRTRERAKTKLEKLQYRLEKLVKTEPSLVPALTGGSHENLAE